jgi:hypothetical protein
VSNVEAIEMNELQALQTMRATLATPGVWVNRHPLSEIPRHHCVGTACNHAGFPHPVARAVYVRLTRLIGKDVNCDLLAIPKWNDAPGRTLSAVLMLLDTAIAECEAEIAASASGTVASRDVRQSVPA